MIPNVSQIISKPLIFPNSGKGLVCDTFSGKPIFHNCTKHFPNESRIFYKLWMELIFSSASGLGCGNPATTNNVVMTLKVGDMQSNNFYLSYYQ